MQNVENIYNRYGKKPLWITEFAIGRWDPPLGPTRDEEDTLLKAVIFVYLHTLLRMRSIYLESEN